MAITRRVHDEIKLTKSRRLRSRDVLTALPAIRPPVRRPGQTRKTGARRSTVHPGHVDVGTVVEQSQRPEDEQHDPDVPSTLNVINRIQSHVDVGTAAEQSQRPEDEQHDPDVPSASQVTNRIQEKWPMIGSSSEEPLTLANDRADFQQPSHSLTPLQTSEKNDTHIEASDTPQIINSQSAVTIGLQDAGDVGISSDGKWDLRTVHEHRFCFEHGKDEWLLGYADRWMYPSDFNVSGAEAELEAMLRKYKSQPWDLKPHHSTSRAECTSELWSHIETPIERSKIKGEVIYLIRWKLCWTIQSNIDDMDWVQTAYQAQNWAIKRRCSTRVNRFLRIW